MFGSFFAIASLLALSAYALDEQDCLTTPYFKDEVQNLLREQVCFYESNLGREIIEGAHQGFVMPWLGAMALGGFIAVKVHEPDEAMAAISKSFHGGVCACICLSPLAFLASLPMSVISASMSSVKWLIAGVRAANSSQAFEQEVSAHLYQWMLLIKHGRLLLAQALKEHRQICERHHGDSSLCETASCYLHGASFNHYFGNTTFSKDDLSCILSNVPADQDKPE